MAFDSDTRNKLARMVTQARQLLSDEFTQQLQEIYGIQPDGTITDIGKLTHLDDEQVSVAQLLRERIDHLVSGMEAEKKPAVEAIDRTIREQAFTILNRFAALRMCEERSLVEECVRGGMQSKGFKVYETIAGSGLGDTYERYKTFLFCLFDEIAVDLGVLFDRFSPQGLLFPREQALLGLLTIINNDDLSKLWAEDETIGWIYQYFNSSEERRAMREASQAPRNSRELAVRNQFFTPRYVVEFLTDNTLGRIWCEMRRGDTVLMKHCRYLGRRPNEVFLNPNENSPTVDNSDKVLSQEELLKHPIYIEHRPKKDPRDLKILDPACGSGHFLLYAFDLLELIYLEAWEDEESPPSGATDKTLRQDYPDVESLRKEIPRLLIDQNLHGIDIDARSVQIAALALWLRAQKTWKRIGLKPTERPRIRKSNTVVAEPMPGEEVMRRDFVKSLDDKLGRLVQHIFKHMALAGEAGSLLKIEEEISSAIGEIYGEYGDLYRESDEERWRRAEADLLKALNEYAERAESGSTLRRRLFSEDAGQGFAFIKLCRQRFDIVIMNPPYGDLTPGLDIYARKAYPESWKDIYACFLERANDHLSDAGMIGALTSLTFFHRKQLTHIRELMMTQVHLEYCVQLGVGVLDDAAVEVTAYTLLKRGAKVTPKSDRPTYYLDLSSHNKKNVDPELQDLVSCTNSDVRVVKLDDFRVLDRHRFCFWVPQEVLSLWHRAKRFEPSFAEVVVGLTTFDNERFLRLGWEIPRSLVAERWFPIVKGGEYCRYFRDEAVFIDWAEQGRMLQAHEIHRYDTNARTTQSKGYYFRPGLTFPRVGKGFAPRVLPAYHLMESKGTCIFFKNQDRSMWLGWLALLNTKTVEYLLEAFGRGRFWETSAVANLPIPDDVRSSLQNLYPIGEKLVAISLDKETYREQSGLFISPTGICESCNRGHDPNFSEQVRVEKEAEDIARSVFKFSSVVHPDNSDLYSDDGKDIVDVKKNQDVIQSCNKVDWHGRLAYVLGVACGRWDVRIARDFSLAPKLPDPFDPLPICPPGMLIGPDGLPVRPGGIVSEEWLQARQDANTIPPEGSVSKATVRDEEYPVHIAWDGILVDDPGLNGGQSHRDDIIQRVREVLEALWGDRAEATEHESCEILGVSGLRNYFQRPTGFFQDHLKRYSKSRRKAPIYWPLSTSSGSYTLWIYYHRLTDQTVYACVNDYVNPRLKNVSKDIERMQKEVAKGATAQDRQQVEKLMDLEQELKDFRDELLRVAALPYKPDLNDGVMITAAPLWNLFLHNQWRKNLEACWKKLEAGEYDWAHLAYAIWPDRVREKCKADLSIAIAHDLEDLYEEDVTKPKKRRKKAKG